MSQQDRKVSGTIAQDRFEIARPSFNPRPLMPHTPCRLIEYLRDAGFIWQQKKELLSQHPSLLCFTCLLTRVTSKNGVKVISQAAKQFPMAWASAEAQSLGFSLQHSKTDATRNLPGGTATTLLSEQIKLFRVPKHSAAMGWESEAIKYG